MTTKTILQKRRLRAELKARRSALPPEQRHEASRRACAVLMSRRVWQQADSVALFHSMHDEVCTKLLLQSAWRTGRRVALPVTPAIGQPLSFRWVTPNTQLIRAHYGAMEPGPAAPHAPHHTIRLVIAPGLGFDSRGARLGYGGGYYDRTMALTGPGVMLAFACQRLDHVPEQPHDVRVWGVATEVGWLTPTERAASME